MAVLFLSSDLVFSSRLASAGQRLGVAVSAVSSIEAAVARMQGEAVQLVILDLATGNTDPTTAVPKLREVANGVSIVAYAPHVHEARLETARAAGCDEVLTRGAFDARMDDLLTRSPAAGFNP